MKKVVSLYFNLFQFIYGLPVEFRSDHKLWTVAISLQPQKCESFTQYSSLEYGQNSVVEMDTMESNLERQGMLDIISGDKHKLESIVCWFRLSSVINLNYIMWFSL